MIGSFERFIAFLIEHYAGAFPLWLAPVQIAIIGVNNSFDAHILKIKQDLINSGFRVEEDLSANTVSYKLRNLSLKKIPYIITIGENEMKNNNISVRKFGQTDVSTITLEEYKQTLLKEMG
jgi:threonyl-tRNA synthetase